MKPATALDLPEYLRPFIIEQQYDLYTAIDHAAWRYILKIAHSFFERHAHPLYARGIRETGISLDRIPKIQEMDQCLRKFGWRAVAVSGFIPPSVFLEFQAMGILPIACDMRKLENLAYTPAPDIVHEAAGHAPIIADPQYAKYLKAYGEVARKAIYSSEDLAVYEAVRKLSEIKEDPQATPTDISVAQRELDVVVANGSYTSEATYLARMAWWTTEYGLVESPKGPLIFGAGLLSSVGESYDFQKSEVIKIPFSLDCVNTSYDITRPQPQLFVATTFDDLTKSLHEFASTMAFRRGGLEGLSKAIRANAVTTTQLDSGVQITGRLERVDTDAHGQASFLKYAGACQLSYGDLELEGQGTPEHRDGYSLAIGLLEKSSQSPAHLSETDLKMLGFVGSKKGKLRFASGVHVSGALKGLIRKNDLNLVLSFEDCTVSRGDEVLFRPEWGTFDLACGHKVVSVFGGPADRAKYLRDTGGFGQEPRTHKSNRTAGDQPLIALYNQVRQIRDQLHESAKADPNGNLKPIVEKLRKSFPEEWLLRYEIAEILSKSKTDRATLDELLNDLTKLRQKSPELSTLIRRGIELL